jgi:hypothetical protein
MFSNISPIFKAASNRIIGIKKSILDKISANDDVRNIYTKVFTVGTAMFVGAGILKTIELYPTFIHIQKDVNEILSVAMVNSKINNSASKNYVIRQKLEDDIKKIFEWNLQYCLWSQRCRKI